jgi:hypothetical protein
MLYRDKGEAERRVTETGSARAVRLGAGRGTVWTASPSLYLTTLRLTRLSCELA